LLVGWQAVGGAKRVVLQEWDETREGKKLAVTLLDLCDNHEWEFYQDAEWTQENDEDLLSRASLTPILLEISFSMSHPRFQRAFVDARGLEALLAAAEVGCIFFVRFDFVLFSFPHEGASFYEYTTGTQDQAVLALTILKRLPLSLPNPVVFLSRLYGLILSPSIQVCTQALLLLAVVADAQVLPH